MSAPNSALMSSKISSPISPTTLHHLLDIPLTTPLTLEAMCRNLRPIYYPAPHLSPRLERFSLALVEAMQGLGIQVHSPEELALHDGRFPAGTVIVAPGIFDDDALPINRVSTLYNNIIVGIYDEAAPVSNSSLPQERLDAIVGRLARDMVHILIFVTDESWTICTMNGGIATFATPLPHVADVRSTLVPKLTAQVVPPRNEAFTFVDGALDIASPTFSAIAEDFVQCSALWSQSSALLTHTSTEGLHYRNSFYKRIVARYLDERSGMSYGFFARQLPIPTLQPAQKKKADGLMEVQLAGEQWFVAIPEVSIITTRSGCRKHCLNPLEDLVALGLKEEQGKRVASITTPSTSCNTVIKPSFDTLAILAHALGNAIVGSILLVLQPNAPFSRHLARNGATITHWHGYPQKSDLPDGYWLHGAENPPVACSTPQSAAYSLLGKLSALEQALTQQGIYHGDVHTEPHHGTNIVGILSLTEVARHFAR